MLHAHSPLSWLYRSIKEYCVSTNSAENVVDITGAENFATYCNHMDFPLK